MTKAEFEQRCYDAYKLDWMISHGYTLRDYLNALIYEDEEASAEGIYPEGDTRDIYEYLDSSFEYETGFPGGTIWVCKDEFLGAEFQDKDYMEHLISLMPNSKEMGDFWRVMYSINKEIKPKMEVETPAGTLRAYENVDNGAPGISIMLQPSGYEEEIDVCMAEVVKNKEYGTTYTGSPEDVSVIIWGDATTEDYTVKEIIRREEVIAGLGTGGMV